MDLILDKERSGRLICELTDGDATATVTASNVPAAGEDLMAALESARVSLLGECLWLEQGGEYRWMFRCDGDRLTVAVMWSAGTLTGWQHVFRSECEFAWFADHVRAEFDRLGLPSITT